MYLVIWAYVVLVVAGVLNVVQSGSNATLYKQLAHPLLPALVAFGVGALALLILLGVYEAWTKAPLPAAQQWGQAPWWAYIGGLLGCVYVIAMVTLSAKVGAGLFTGLTVTAGIVTSLAMDHFGLLGFDRHAASWPRLAGGALMIAGLVMIGKY